MGTRKALILIYFLSIVISLYSQTSSTGRPIIAQDTLPKKSDSIAAVEIHTERGAYYNGKGVGLQEILTESEFKKAACCTLSESFELSNTVEVSNADGVSGIKQVEMLGLSGKYVLMSRENIPSINGLATLNGLSNIPGPMVSAVQLAKGAGSATLGYDGLTGGLNYQLKANIKDPKLFVNLYSNQQARSEMNVISKSIIANRAINHLYLHTGGQYRTTDMGKDGMADMPLSQRYFIADHFQIPGKKVEIQGGGLAYSDKKQGGTLMSGSNNEISLDSRDFRFDFHDQHAEAYSKIGIFMNKSGSKSIGNIFDASKHQTISTLNSLIDRKYDATEERYYYSGVYQTETLSKNRLNTGIALSANHLNETLRNYRGDSFQIDGWQKTAGVFSEYTMEGSKLSAVIGIRADYHNVYKGFFTPRLHAKYQINKTNRINIQGGMARRSSYFIAENLPLLINGRGIFVDSSSLIQNKWLPQEKAWNYGLSYMGNFMLFDYPATLVMDYFETKFLNQVLVDRDQNATEVYLKSVKGKEAGKTRIAQLDLNGYLHRRLSFKMSYRWINSQQWLNFQFQQQPLQSVHRAIGALQYQTRNKWYLDAVFQFNSRKRLPYYSSINHSQHPGFSPNYWIVNFQVRKVISQQFEFYFGGENLANVSQHHPIMNWQNPSGKDFDAGYAWGPTNGRTIYVGLRWSIF
jgi:hypothetical protein